MKFLTENDLRVAYHEFPFETFTIPPQTKLTPGARTFLMDRKVTIKDDNSLQKKRKWSPVVPSHCQKEKEDVEKREYQSDWLMMRCEFFRVAEELAVLDSSLSEEILLLERALAVDVSEANYNLPHIIQIEKVPERVDRSFIEDNLSVVGLCLHKSKGRILRRLYSLYFQLGALSNQYRSSDCERFLEVANRLGQLIAYYLNKTEEGSYDSG
ncbi:hypothetical protein [Streptococcus merionis]|uniref:Ethanolamine utilization cobalamin adenosyltransferase n=1 Tax=Streptococcus merionis TaxID=400065 RepID=A0A239SZP4_9STRE|nr:hypothetical protein [Streptococcus merionis]SNU90951.1 Ethanolamine utilization cobalamin adenosyltransferase [Streptococcus merionis]